MSDLLTLNVSKTASFRPLSAKQHPDWDNPVCHITSADCIRVVIHLDPKLIRSLRDQELFESFQPNGKGAGSLFLVISHPSNILSGPHNMTSDELLTGQASE